jgi:3-dehydroquinate dehydratase / shikimate dehydrogenase
MLCLTLTEDTLEKNLLLLQKHRKLIGAAELRIDLLSPLPSADALARFTSRCEVPVIAACRRKRDGGGFRQSERVRMNLLARLSGAGFAYFDLEEDVPRGSLDQDIRKGGSRIIRSIYDAQQVPGNLFTRMLAAADAGDIPKAIVRPNTFSDVARVFEARRELQTVEKKIIVAAGAYGVPARILYRRTGSFITYCEPGTAASGHLSVESLGSLYRAAEVSDHTRIFGVIGNPVLHSASPAIHNPGYEKIGLDAVYVPFQVDSVRAFFSFADWFGISGFSVTVPHKQAVLPYLGTITREVKQIGSCNTVIRSRKLWKGVNTDYYGFLHPIQEELEVGHIRKALVIGAGGAARAAVWALRNFGCAVTIVNRTAEKAEKLAAQTGSSAVTVEEAAAMSDPESDQHPDLIVQTTSAGMEPDTETDPLSSYRFSGSETVYELVYKPRVTKLLARALSAGCRTVYGYEMLYAQGIQQFSLFTGQEYQLN